MSVRNLLVVGGGSGIGLAAARLAAEAGEQVVIADLDPDAADRASEIGAGFVSCDAREAESVQGAVAHTVERLGQLGSVLTTVGGAHVGNIGAMTPGEWAAELSFNLTSAFNIGQAALTVFQRQGGGAIVTTSSGYAVMPGADRPAYVAAKAGVIAFTRSLAASLAPYKARANCIAPGPTDTPRFRAMNGGDEGVERVRASMPMGEIPKPEDCARVALFLLSDGACQVTGQVIHVNGGLLMP